jgi:hypothetical protein
MKKLRYGVLIVALVASGIYLFLYLYRWEWHRALVAGVIFVAAEVGLATAAILDRLRTMESRLTIWAARNTEDVLARLQETAPESKVNFEWLSPRDGQLSVFVPVLLGAGVILSGVAWLVERMARATARPVLERGLAMQLAPLSMPSGTLLGNPAVTALPRRHLGRQVVIAAVASVAGVGAIFGLAELTQDRPDSVRPHAASSVVIATSAKPDRPALETAEALWGACTTALGRGYEVDAVRDIGGGMVEYVVRPEIGKYTKRRFEGCVRDGTTDRLSGRIQQIAPVG